MDRSTQFAKFGARAAALLDQWQQQNHRPLTAPAWLDTGGSGASLASVFVRDSDPGRTTRRMIIKLCSPDGDSSMEPGRLIAARRSLPNGESSFPRAHLVEQLYDPMPVDDAWLMFQGFAGNDETMVTLSTILRQRRMPGVAGQITRSLLADWNPDEKWDGEMTAAAFVSELLDRRLEPEEPLAVWVRDKLGLDLETAWIRPGRTNAGPLPNPVHLTGSCPLAEHTLDYPMRGRAHGDLHPGNIMVPKEPDADIGRYVLIDLSRFDEQALLARDPMHLLLCLVADFLPHLSDDARAELLELLVGRDTPGLLIPQGLARTVDEVRKAPDDWLRQRTISGQWPGQWLLSMQACALMFTARARYDARDRWWFFRLAAEAAGAYLRSVDAYEPGEAVLVPGPREAEPAVVEAVVAAVKLPQQAAPPDAKRETKPESTPAPDPVRIPAPAPTPVQESVASGLAAADESLPDAAPSTPAQALPDALPALLIDLRNTFADRQGEVREYHAGSVAARTLGLIREQSERGQADLKALLTSRHDALDEEARNRLDAVLGRLAHVTEAANAPGFSYEQPLFLRDLAHRALVVALDTLLESTRQAALDHEAGEADGAGQATDPIRPEGARTPSG
ncbi:hypothetical protein ACFC1L_19880 [Streptomyces sp. NPDC056210]|uniref:hypothetical protein n=1 Tax=unclassified Streptomyces TaxID=2593676 RepID=UPI002255D3B6|nr:hypothetical protein [Streptomyces sp. NBC_00401]MCX5086047.1 hypothetical protein [Streptomyces sp. NBC_00401]